MNLFALSGILIGVSSFSMAVLMFFIGKERLHYIWSLFCLSVAVWGFGGYQIAITQNAAEADFWWRITHIGVIFIPILFTHFVYRFLNKQERLLLWILYCAGFFFLLTNFWGDLFIQNMRWVFDQFYYDSPPGIVYPFFTAFFFGLVIYSHLILWRALRVATGFQRTKIQYFFVGMLVSFSGGGLSFLPVYGIDLYPVLNLAAFLYTPILTYAILRKQLFDIKTMLTQLLVGFIAFLLLVNILASQAFFEYVWKTVLFVIFLFAGYLLIKSMLNEIKIREELEDAYAKLKELDQAKSEFLSIASHQLRTPLTAIKGYIAMILEGSYGKMTAEQKKPMENVYQSNERLIILVNNLLNISRIESGKIEMNVEEGSLEKIIQGAVDELKIKAEEKGLKLSFEKPASPLPLIRFDVEKIRNALLNIIDNAIRYTHQGEILLSISPVDDTALLVEVKDTGEGMIPEEISGIFRSFTRGLAGQKTWTEGAGLGLYIAKQFVQLHGGKVFAESQGKGKGSTFFIQLPLRFDPAKTIQYIKNSTSSL